MGWGTQMAPNGACKHTLTGRRPGGGRKAVGETKDARADSLRLQYWR